MCEWGGGLRGGGGWLLWGGFASDSCHRVPGIHEIQEYLVSPVSGEPQEPGFSQLPCTGASRAAGTIEAGTPSWDSVDSAPKSWVAAAHSSAFYSPVSLFTPCPLSQVSCVSEVLQHWSG